MGVFLDSSLKLRKWVLYAFKERVCGGGGEWGEGGQSKAERKVSVINARLAHLIEAEVASLSD